MAIPENQLETWANQGATGPASALYERIDKALKNDSALQDKKFEVFLQGSYKNDTNIHGDSDVDVVAMLTNIETDQMCQIERGYTLTYFRSDITKAIRRAFSTHNITEGGKSIKIPRTSNNIPADVVPCLECRFSQPPKILLGDATYVEGIWLQDTKRNHSVISFPKQSYDNGVAKHRRTGERYKPTVRIFKNARGWMEDNRLIQIGSASSHNIECLLYNVPDHKFSGSYADTFVNVLNWLKNADLTSFICQNEIQNLFEPERWTQQSARTYIRALIHIWNNWK